MAVQSRYEPSSSDVLNKLDELSMLTLATTFLLGARTVRSGLLRGSGLRGTVLLRRCAGLLLQSLTDFDDPEAAAAPSIAVGVLITLVHLFYIGYFLRQLLPELFTKLRTL